LPCRYQTGWPSGYSVSHPAPLWPARGRVQHHAGRILQDAARHGGVDAARCIRLRRTAWQQAGIDDSFGTTCSGSTDGTDAPIGCQGVVEAPMGASMDAVRSLYN
jgi:hypothetical protein